MEARGIKWTPKPTEKEKAAAAFQKLLSENPDFVTLVPGSQSSAYVATPSDTGAPDTA
jgi:hypothetical protein